MCAFEVCLLVRLASVSTVVVYGLKYRRQVQASCTVELLLRCTVGVVTAVAAAHALLLDTPSNFVSHTMPAFVFRQTETAHKLVAKLNPGLGNKYEKAKMFRDIQGAKNVTEASGTQCVIKTQGHTQGNTQGKRTRETHKGNTQGNTQGKHTRETHKGTHKGTPKGTQVLRL